MALRAAHLACLALASLACLAQALPRQVMQSQQQLIKADDTKILVELFVMSRCPDAQFAEAQFAEVLKTVGNITTLELHFIANPRGQEIGCKHGPMECTGNEQQICVQQYAPASSFAFASCVNEDPSNIGKPELADSCLDALNVEAAAAAKIKSCMTGYEGQGLLRGDAERTMKLGVEKSCTIFIEGQQRCIRDGDAWYDCPDGAETADFVSSICTAYWANTGKWPVECGVERKAMTKKIITTVA